MEGGIETVRDLILITAGTIAILREIRKEIRETREHRRKMIEEKDPGPE